MIDEPKSAFVFRERKDDLRLPPRDRSVEGLIEFCRVAGRTAYQQQALIWYYQERRFEDGYPVLAVEHWNRFTELGIGLDPRGHLYQLWWVQLTNFLQGQATDTQLRRLLLWGATAKAGKRLWKELAVLGRETGLLDRTAGRGVLLREWLTASGVRHPKTLEAAERIIEKWEDEDLSRHPSAGYAPLDRAIFDWVNTVVATKEQDPEKRKRLAFYFFACLSRIAAYQVAGRVRWRSEWLRGERANADAIPGTSAFSAVLTDLLMTHVLDKIKGHSHGAGSSKAATYRLKVELRPGTLHREDFVKWLGLELDDRKKLKVTRRHR